MAQYNDNEIIVVDRCGEERKLSSLLLSQTWIVITVSLVTSQHYTYEH